MRKWLFLWVILLVADIPSFGQDVVLNTLRERKLSVINLVTEGWVRYEKVAPHFTAGRAILKEFFRNEDSVMDKKYFCADIIARDTQLVCWKLSGFRDETLTSLDSFTDASVKLPPVKPVAEPDIEQIAFDYFVAGIDTIRFYDEDTTFRFISGRSKLYFSKDSRSSPYTFLKEFNLGDKKILSFLSVKSDSEIRNMKFYTDLGLVAVTANQPFVTTSVGTFNELEDDRKDQTDIKLKLTNRLYYRGNYYVYMVVTQRVDMIRNSFLIKIDKTGKPVGMIRSIPAL